MINYSILDVTKLEDENPTIRLEEGEFYGSIFTFNPVIVEKDSIQYGIETHELWYNNNNILLEYKRNIDNEPTLEKVLKASSANINFLLKELDTIFYDVLRLLKDRITYGDI